MREQKGLDELEGAILALGGEGSEAIKLFRQLRTQVAGSTGQCSVESSGITPWNLAGGLAPWGNLLAERNDEPVLRLRRLVLDLLRGNHTSPEDTRPLSAILG